MQDEQELPIDIHTNKLLDWLISRRHCSREWANSILIIREKINNAIQDMPANDEITKLLSGTYINYFHCKRIVEILKETESETKNIFGRYSSQRMKDWLEIVNLYEKDNIYLAEAAHLLIQNVKYEIPALKKQITKLQQVQQDCEKKAADQVKVAKEMKDKYNTTCRQMGIKGDNIKVEFAGLLKDMPLAYEGIINEIKKLTDGINYYTCFTEYVTGKTLKDTLPLINYLKEKGNTTIYEWKHGKKPLVIEEPILNFEDKSTQNADAIDFGDDIIDFGDDNKIDFGDEVDLTASTNNADADDSSVARNEEALTLLDCCGTRNDFINELCELQSFLEIRALELQAENDLLSMNQFQSAPDAIQLQTVEKVTAMIIHTKNVMNLIGDVKLKQLFTIKESPKYIDRLADSLSQMLLRADKISQQQQTVMNKGKDALAEEFSLKPKLSVIIERTKELQTMIENEISKKYKNRPVNIMGSVNVL